MDPVLDREVEVCQQDLAVLEHLVDGLRIFGAIGRLELIDRQISCFLILGIHDVVQGRLDLRLQA